MGKQADVYAALKTTAEALATLLVLDLAFLDDDFEATIDPVNTFDPFLQAKLFRNVPAWQGLSSGRLDQGLFQIDLVWPRGKPPADAYPVVDQIIGQYPRGARLGMLKVERVAWAASPLTEVDRTLHPITIPWTI